MCGTWRTVVGKKLLLLAGCGLPIAEFQPGRPPRYDVSTKWRFQGEMSAFRIGKLREFQFLKRERKEL
jgi:hypothetical protein